jgi:hypothetical protein
LSERDTDASIKGGEGFAVAESRVGRVGGARGMDTVAASWAATFAHGIVGIVAVGADKEMSWVAAWGVIAGVTTEQAARDWGARVKSKSEAVRKATIEHTVAARIALGCPRPTGIWAA